MICARSCRPCYSAVPTNPLPAEVGTGQVAMKWCQRMLAVGVPDKRLVLQAFGSSAKEAQLIATASLNVSVL